MKSDILDKETYISADFAALGLGDVAFVKPVIHEGEAMWSIHSANGEAIAMTTQRDLAFALVRQNNLDPLSVH